MDIFLKLFNRSGDLRLYPLILLNFGLILDNVKWINRQPVKSHLTIFKSYMVYINNIQNTLF